jgi:ubiquilin
VGAGAAAPNPALFQALLSGGGLGGGLSGSLGPFGAPPAAAPADSRPPEERFQLQFQQLQDMDFTNVAQIVRALLATGANVYSAIECILGGGGL